MADLAGLLGMAARAGCVVSGEDACIRAVRAGKARAVVIASDIGGNGAKKLRDKCSYYHVPTVAGPEKAQLGKAVGKEVRTAVGIISNQWAQQIVRAATESSGGDGI